ncbi:MAG: tetratricopeptide repeat protein [Desulfobacterales bacterium]|nr:tetratricopeptide repeat protein [Desulfobacterales bacterium]
MAELYRDTGRYEKAESLHRRGLAIVEKALGRDHPSYAGSLNNLADLYISQGRSAEAGQLYVNSLKIMEKNIDSEEPKKKDDQSDVSESD